jgi:hypothetical protein
MMGHTKVSDAAGKTGQGEYEIELNGTKLSDDLGFHAGLLRLRPPGHHIVLFNLTLIGLDVPSG